MQEPGLGEMIPKLSQPNIRLQAQIEAFADEVAQPSSKDQILLEQYSTDLAIIPDLDHLPANFPKDLATVVTANRDRFIEFTQTQNPDELIAREQSIRRYNDKFKPVIVALKDKIDKEDPTRLPEYLGSGEHNGSRVFVIEVDGKRYAAKYISRGLTNHQVAPLLAARGIPHGAQLAGHSLRDKVIIMDLMAGKPVGDFRPEEAPEYSDEQIIDLVKMTEALETRGLVLDFNASNCLYDQEQGFGVIDFMLPKQRQIFQSKTQQIADLRKYLYARKYEALDPKAPDFEEKRKAQLVQKAQIELSTSVRFINILNRLDLSILKIWKNEFEEMRVKGPFPIPMVERRGLPEDTSLKPYLDELTSLGF